MGYVVAGAKEKPAKFYTFMILSLLSCCYLNFKLICIYTYREYIEIGKE